MKGMKEEEETGKGIQNSGVGIQKGNQRLKIKRKNYKVKFKVVLATDYADFMDFNLGRKKAQKKQDFFYND